MKWHMGILRAFGIAGDQEEEAKEAAEKAERRRAFGQLYEHMGHHGAVASSTVRTTAGRVAQAQVAGPRCLRMS